MGTAPRVPCCPCSAPPRNRATERERARERERVLPPECVHLTAVKCGRGWPPFLRGRARLRFFMTRACRNSTAVQFAEIQALHWSTGRAIPAIFRVVVFGRVREAE